MINTKKAPGIGEQCKKEPRKVSGITFKAFSHSKKFFTKREDRNDQSRFEQVFWCRCRCYKIREPEKFGANYLRGFARVFWERI